MRTNQLDTHQTDLATLQAVTAAAAEIFTAPPRRHAAMIYLRQRGIPARDLASGWSFGYAPPGWTRLVDRLSREFGDQALLDAGIAHRCSRGTLIDTFRDRVIFGIHNDDGQLVGFIGRDLSANPNAPKYLNTHNHALFDKSTLLFGLIEGRHDAYQQPVVVEGPLDVLAIASRSTPGRDGLLPVASCGTAFTAAQARLVSQAAYAHHSPVVVAMDGDGAGRLAALTTGDKLRSIGLDVRVVTLANGTDPAEYLMRPDATLETFRAENALPLFTVRVEHAIAAQGERMQWVEGRLSALRSIASHLATYPPSYTTRQVGWLANTLDLAPSTISAELDRAGHRHKLGFGDPELRPAFRFQHDEGRLT